MLPSNLLCLFNFVQKSSTCLIQFNYHSIETRLKQISIQIITEKNPNFDSGHHRLSRFTCDTGYKKLSQYFFIRCCRFFIFCIKKRYTSDNLSKSHYYRETVLGSKLYLILVYKLLAVPATSFVQSWNKRISRFCL